MQKKAGFLARVSALIIDEIILVSGVYLLFLRLGSDIPGNVGHRLWFVLLVYETIDYNYFTLSWYFWGQTLGKRLLRTKVVKSDGSAILYRDAFIRYWAWMIGVAVLGLGYFWIAWEKNKRGWNDIAAKTYVVKW